MACANQKVLLVDIKFGNRYALSRHIFRATVTNTFDRIFNDVWNDALNLIPDALKNTPCNLNDCFVFVSCKPNKVDRSSIALNETLETVLSLFNSIINFGNPAISSRKSGMCYKSPLKTSVLLQEYLPL